VAGYSHTPSGMASKLRGGCYAPPLLQPMGTKYNPWMCLVDPNAALRRLDLQPTLDWAVAAEAEWRFAAYRVQSRVSGTISHRTNSASTAQPARNRNAAS
jgi:hypothetical protein